MHVYDEGEWYTIGYRQIKDYLDGNYQRQCEDDSMADRTCSIHTLLAKDDVWNKG
jgi:hypothetical protein